VYKASIVDLYFEVVPNVELLTVLIVAFDKAFLL